MEKVDPYLHGVLLLHGAKKEVDEAGLTSVLKAAGIEVDKAKVNVLVNAVKEVNFEDLLKNAVYSGVPAQTAASAEVKPADKKEKKQDTEDQKKTEEHAAEGLASLFG